MNAELERQLRTGSYEPEWADVSPIQHQMGEKRCPIAQLQLCVSDLKHLAWTEYTIISNLSMRTVLIIFVSKINKAKKHFQTYPSKWLFSGKFAETLKELPLLRIPSGLWDPGARCAECWVLVGRCDPVHTEMKTLVQSLLLLTVYGLESRKKEWGDKHKVTQWIGEENGETGNKDWSGWLCWGRERIERDEEKRVTLINNPLRASDYEIMWLWLCD